jgi:hypothetical protein
METNEYTKQANDFLAKTETSFSAEFLKHDKYFPDDKESRDIYKVSFKRGKRSFSLTFGQSIVKSAFYFTMGRMKIDLNRNLLDKPNGTLLLQIGMLFGHAFKNNNTSDIIHYPEAPTPYDVLACLTKYDPGTFEDFCGEFGYDTDSRNAERTYKAFFKEWGKVQSLWSEDEIEAMREIQ